MDSIRNDPTRLSPGFASDAVRVSKITALTGRARDFDELLLNLLRPLAVPCLRVLLGVVFVWFGGLKVAGVSPVKALVAGTLPWFNPDVVVPLLGGVEVLLGLGLVTGVALRLALPVLAAHLTGTFLTFVMLPHLMFRASDPLLLTQNGEFVAKNLILISATLVLIVQTRSASKPVANPRAAV